MLFEDLGLLLRRDAKGCGRVIAGNESLCNGGGELMGKRLRSIEKIVREELQSGGLKLGEGDWRIGEWGDMCLEKTKNRGIDVGVCGLLWAKEADEGGAGIAESSKLIDIERGAVRVLLKDL